MIDVVVQESWTRIRETLRAEIGERFFAMWFERCNVIDLRRGVLALGVPNLFIRDWIEEHYADGLGRIASEEIGAAVRLQVRVDPELFREMRAEADRAEAAAPAVDAIEHKTLDSYLPTAGSALALRALRHVVLGLEPPMNPLVIHGVEGTGKSHLAASLARAVHPGLKVFRTSGEEFARRFAWNLKTRRIDAFRAEITSSDVVVIDDAEVLAGKMATQRELSNLWQVLKAKNAQVVAFLARHPKDVQDLDSGFESILLSGMLLEIEPPTPAETVRILEQNLKGGRCRVGRGVVQLVVAESGGSVKRLDRLLRKLYAFAGLTGEPVDEDFVRKHLSEMSGSRDPEDRRVESILGFVEENFEVTREDLLSKRKTKALATPRGVAVYLLREHGGMTFKSIGRRLGERSHTSVFLMYQKYCERVTKDAVLSRLVREAGRRILTAGTG